MAVQRRIDLYLRRRILPVLLLIISALVGGSLYFRIQGVQRHSLDVATEGARNIFRIMVRMRQWNADRGGIYAFVSEDLPPNPSLKSPDRDITLPDGRTLTLINPAYMTRQIAELAQVDPSSRVQIHITSLHPLRLANRADPWETETLRAFEQGTPEVVAVEKNEKSGAPLLRYMAPLFVTPACMACHAGQGYQVGDVRGGISVSQDYQPIQEAVRREVRLSIYTHAFFFALLAALAWGLVDLLARRWRELDLTIETLLETRNKLVESEKMASLGRLVAGFAHELNTPVGVAVGAVTQGDLNIARLGTLLTQEEVSEGDVRRQLDYLRECHQLALSNLQRTVELVQRFKRTSIDCSSEQKREFELGEVIRDVLVALKNALKRPGIQVRVSCPAGLKLYGTPGLIGQVLTNLITNSIAHGFDGGERAGHITIDASLDEGRRVQIHYTDDGKGMSEEVRRQAFEPFFTTRRGQGGSGLGLYLAYNIVTQQMGGTIRLESSPGAGVHFFMDFPVEYALPQQDISP